jgi:hypothetical protein
MDIGFEVAPHDTAVAALKADVKLATRRRIFHGSGIIAIDRVEVIRVNAAQKLARVLGIKASENVLYPVFACVRRRRQEILALNFALQIKGKTALGVNPVELGTIGGDQLAIPEFPADRQVGERHIEPVV